MKPGTSVLLDAVRFCSALGVFASHCLLPWFSNVGPIPHLHTAAHACVMIFFVLSGYVVTYTTIGRRRTWVQYCAARLARLYSVVVPAILLTAFLWALGRHLAPAHYANFDRSHEILRLALTTFFQNEFWFWSSAPPTNLPFWSLAYEFAYYALFGLAVFVRRPVWRIVALVGMALICGPKVLLLFPVWLAGVAAYVATENISLTRLQAALGAVVLIALCIAGLPRIPFPLETFGLPPLFYSALFAHDCVLGAVFAAIIFLADQLLGNITVPQLFARAIKVGAGFTFSLYLLHMPLLVFTAGVFHYDKTSPRSVARAGFYVLLVTLAIGYWFERRDLLKAIADRIEALILRCTRRRELASAEN